MLQLCNLWQDVCFPHLFDDSKIMKTILDIANVYFVCSFALHYIEVPLHFFLDLKLYILLLIQYKDPER